jgi:hypothetical protein
MTFFGRLRHTQRYFTINNINDGATLLSVSHCFAVKLFTKRVMATETAFSGIQILCD